MEEGKPRGDPLLPFLAGFLAGAAGAVLARALLPRRVFDPRLLEGSKRGIPPVVLVPGILGSELRKADGTRAWLNVGNAFGTHELALPATLPPRDSRDELRPGGLLGVDTVLPRLFGFTEYIDFVELLHDAGFTRGTLEEGSFHIFTYDWRRDLVETAAALGAFLDGLGGSEPGHPGFTLVGHSMGGLVTRYYLRYGGAAPRGDVTWEGARHVRNMLLVATPSGGSLPALEALLVGERVGLSSTTLSSQVVERMPAIYSLLPPRGAAPLVGETGETIKADVLDPETWRRFSWGPFAPARRASDDEGPAAPAEVRQAFLSAALRRAREIQDALEKHPDTACPSRVALIGGDCLPTLGHALMADRPGALPRFLPRSRKESDLMYEAGDGRVTRSSALCAHLPSAAESELGCGIPEVSQVFFGDADHHGIYGEVTFQSELLRMLLRPPRVLPERSREQDPVEG
jgi:pimeloyl-ACP methyl ester carboxylesterase